MSLLDIISEASAQIGLPGVSQVIGNQDQNVRQMVSLLKSGGNMIANVTNADGGTWSILERIYEFQTTEGEAEYLLPSDFSKLVTETVWQKDKYWKMRGSATPRQWEMVRNRQAKTPYNIFRILRTQIPNNPAQISLAGGKAPQAIRRFALEPAPGADITLVYEYVSQDWWIDGEGTQFKREPTNDSDESLFGNHLHILDVIWRFKSANGLKFADELAQFEMERDRMLVQDAATEYIPAGIDRRHYANKDDSDIEWGWTA